MEESDKFALTRSEKRILNIFFRRGFQSQAEIAELTELKQQSVSRLLANLKKTAFIIEGKKVTSGKRGYPTASFTLNPNKVNSIGVGIMSDVVCLTLVDFKGNILSEAQSPLPSMTKRAVLNWVKIQLQQLKQQSMFSSALLAGVGVSISGSYINEEHGFNTPHYLQEWYAVDIASFFSEHLAMPAWVENDGNVAALGESMTGVGRWAENFAYVYISSGIGGGIVLNGEVWKGKNGNAGEFAGGLPPNIYPFPNLELLRQIVSKRGNHFNSVYELLENFDINWPANDEWITKVRDSFCIIASNACAILDLDAVVLGGRLPKALAEKLIPLLEFYDQRRRAVERPPAKLIAAEAKGNAAALGAAMLPICNQLFVPFH